MSDPENFLSRWSRLKRESDAAPDAETDAPAADPAAAAPDVETAGFDLSRLPSLDSIGANTDVSLFMQPGVPAALRHAALRRAWASDPTIRDFRGLQENHWDFTAPEDVPGFGRFNSEEEVRALAQRLFGGSGEDARSVSQSAPQDSANARPVDVRPPCEVARDKDQDVPPLCTDASDTDDKAAVQQDEDAAVQRASARRHGGALPQ